jgi:hypothetical protein
MKTPSAEAKNVVRISLSNRCVWNGRYDYQDDWQLEAYGNTYEAAVRAAASDSRIAVLHVASVRVDVITVLDWLSPDGTAHRVPVDSRRDYCCRKLKSPKIPTNASNRVMADIVTTPRYKLAVRRKEDGERMVAERKRKAAEKIERDQLAALQAKYPKKRKRS